MNHSNDNPRKIEAHSANSNNVADRRIVGISYNSSGVGIVAIGAADAGTKILRSFANVAIGPIADDWQLISGVIAVLPEAFSPLSHDITLRCTGRVAPKDLRVLRALGLAFPEAKNVNSSVISGWLLRNSLAIKMPTIPEAEAWCAPLIRSAAQTALYASRNLGGGKP